MLITIYLILVNAIAFLLMLIDKQKAKKIELADYYIEDYYEVL